MRHNASKVSRRRVLKALGAGMIGVGAAAGGFVFWPTPPVASLRPVDPTVAQRGIPLVNRTPWPNVTVSVVETATATVPEGLMVAGGDWRREFTITIPAVLIRHPHATLLFDAGLSTQFLQRTQGSLIGRAGGAATLNPAAIQFAEHGLEPDRIDMIVLSHAHADHTDAITDFPRAELVLSAGEVPFAQQQPPTNPIVAELRNEQRRWRLIEFTPQPVGVFDESHDLFHDGSVMLVPLPSHTPGHMGLIITLGSGRRYFFVGDATWSLRGLINRAEKSRPVRVLLDEERAQIRHTIAQINALLAARADVIAIPAHDRAAQAGLAR